MFKQQKQKKEERVMKHLKIIGLAIVIMLMIIPVSAKAEGLGNARLSLMDGDVQIKSEDSSEWLPASVNMPLRDGDSIWVPDGSRAEVQLAGGTQVRLDELSSLDLLNISRDSSQFYLAEGIAYVNFRGGRSSGLVQIDTPVTSVRAYDRAAFGVDVAGNGDTDLSVFLGLVHAETKRGRTRVTEGNALAIGDDYADLAPLGRENEWDRWNTDRDRRFEEKKYSSRYLPDELDTYANDFDDNGKWVNVGGHGYVWTPTVQVSAGWSPYRNGRWCWIGGDYVWVGYEPWGWAPYHYGRWDYSAAVGWFWVPPARGDVYWSPGYVGWVRTPTYVAWIPLAPREIYYGHGNYGKHSVNLLNVNINTIVVKDRYRHVRVHNAVTTVHHDTFVRGRHVDFKVKENPFLREKINIGRPDIKPERESRMAVVRDIPRAKEPPKKVKEIKVREIRESRPMVRDREKSAFSHDKPDRQMKVQTFDKPTERRKDRSEESSKDRDKKFKASERQQTEERGKEIAPADQPSQKKKQRQLEQRGQQTEQPKQEVLQPERTKKREFRTTDETAPNQPKVNRRDSEPAPDRQIQREERQQKKQEKQPDKQNMKQDKKPDKQKDKEDKNAAQGGIKEKRKKDHEEKDGAKPSGEGSQQPPVR